MNDTSDPLSIAVHTGISLHLLGAIEVDYEDRGFRLVHVRAQYCVTWEDLHREFSAAFQFPWYYGNNSAALEECLSEAAEVEPASVGVVISMWNCSALLRDETDRSSKLDRFQDLLDDVAAEMAAPSGVVVGAAPVRRSLVLLLHDEKDSAGAQQRSLRDVAMGLS